MNIPEYKRSGEQLVLTNKQKSFLNTFAAIANNAMTEYQNNTHKQVVKEVKPHQTKEELE
ncbi:hypothetical protein SAMN05421676_103104 [Salinibacillus kushneri]|uniref:Uncharacterized protein n=1 Tax=Salinibacillus kushneri TaxID=237682 RepID=A0A1I0CCB4_9BACI|nr:hypothetical protein [Salinibacillus kushneri]SET16748.1 hypothetical protein SAMN05421676_103104 [Salinibacillus kushneri]